MRAYNRDRRSFFQRVVNPLPPSMGVRRFNFDQRINRRRRSYAASKIAAAVRRRAFQRPRINRAASMITRLLVRANYRGRQPWAGIRWQSANNAANLLK